MEDKTFGTMTFKRGWIKNELLQFWGTERSLKIRLSAYPEEKPTEYQEKAYESFKENIKEISNESIVRLAMFAMNDSESGLASNLEKAIDELENYVQIEEILFFKDGSYAIVCNAEWTENGIAVLVTDSKIETGYCDELLGCRI